MTIYSIPDVAEKLGVPYQTLFARVRRGAVRDGDLEVCGTKDRYYSHEEMEAAMEDYRRPKPLTPTKTTLKKLAKNLTKEQLAAVIEMAKEMTSKKEQGEQVNDMNNTGWILAYDVVADKCDLVADPYTSRRGCLIKVIDGDKVIDKGEYPTVELARQAMKKEVTK